MPAFHIDTKICHKCESEAIAQIFNHMKKNDELSFDEQKISPNGQFAKSRFVRDLPHRDLSFESLRIRDHPHSQNYVGLEVGLANGWRRTMAEL